MISMADRGYGEIATVLYHASISCCVSPLGVIFRQIFFMHERTSQNVSYSLVQGCCRTCKKIMAPMGGRPLYYIINHFITASAVYDCGIDVLASYR